MMRVTLVASTLIIREANGPDGTAGSFAGHPS